MNKGQVELMDKMMDDLKVRFIDKYTKGAHEHKTVLTDHSAQEIAEMLLEEAIDSVAYSLALIYKLKEMEDKLNGIRA